MSNPKVFMFGVHLDSISLVDAVDTIQEWVSEGGLCRYVVTPNVDHVVKLQNNPNLLAAYQDASLVLADGYPVVWAASLLGKRLPERVPGSDLVPALFDAENHEHKMRVFLLGAGPGVAAPQPAGFTNAGQEWKSAGHTVLHWASRTMRPNANTYCN